MLDAFVDALMHPSADASFATGNSLVSWPQTYTGGRRRRSCREAADAWPWEKTFQTPESMDLHEHLTHKTLR